MKKESGLNVKKNKFFTRKRIIILLIVIFAVVIIAVFGTNIYLYINMLLGNDVLINLNADKENLFLVNGQSESIDFSVSVLMNPFCETDCHYVFDDLSESKRIGENDFILSTTTPRDVSYDVIAPSTGEGQKIYRFDVNCVSRKSFFCHSSDELKTKNLVVTLNYQLNNQSLSIKENTKNVADDLFNQLNYLNASLEYLTEKTEEFNKVVIYESGLNSSYFNGEINKDYSELIMLRYFWNNYSYDFVYKNLIGTGNSVNVLDGEIYNLSSDLSKNIFIYNGLLENLSIYREGLIGMKKNNFTNSTLIEFDGTVELFNSVVNSFGSRDSLDRKKNLVYNFSSRFFELKNLVGNESNRDFVSLKVIGIINASKIVLSNISINRTEFFVDDKNYLCCFEGKCENCCNDSCYDSRENFPVVFVHGHDFSRGVSAEYSINSFDEMQRALENEGYINFGSFLPTNENSYHGVWGLTFNPVSIRASYYFDVLQYTDKKVIIQTKTDNIDSYAIRLNEIIDAIRYKTNRDKVNIVAHSMGGLVARRYLQLFGDGKVNKLIMVGTPNNGISGTTSTYCPVFGASAECNDLKADSLLINKLTNGARPSIPIYNIIGLGCNTDGETGDGVVKSSSAYLDFAENFYVNGNCTTLEYLHNDLIKPSKYPEVLKIVVEALRG